MADKSEVKTDVSKDGLRIVESGPMTDEVIIGPKRENIRRPVRQVRGLYGYGRQVNSLLEEMGKSIVGSPALTDRIRGVPHEYDFDLYEALYKTDSLVFRGVNITAHHVMQPGFIIEGGSKTNRQLIEDWVQYIGLETLLHDTVKSLLIWGNSFFEIVRDSKNDDFGIIDLKSIPPSTMYVYRTETGDVIGYIQIPKTRRNIRGYNFPKRPHFRIPKTTKKDDLKTEKKRGWKGQVRDAWDGAVPFDEKEIIHVKLNAAPGAEYGLSVIEPMMTALTIYQGMRIDIGVISRRYASPKILWLVGDETMPANDQMMDDFRRYMNISNIGDDVVIPAWVSFEVLGAGESTMNIQPYLQLLRDDVFAGLSVPEILMGGTIKGTLASAEVQLESFSRRIVVIQRKIAHMVRRQVFPLVLGMEGPLTRLQWNSIPRVVFRPIETEEQRYLRAKNLYDSYVISKEEARRLLKMPDEPDGQMKTEDEIKVVMAGAAASPAGDGSRGPSQTTGGGGDDKSKSEKPDGKTPKKQGAGVGKP
ncbi:MAG: phage portal protein [Candidatus Thorarchaeota archaeon]|jgi:hypothetical protein